MMRGLSTKILSKFTGSSSTRGPIKIVIGAAGIFEPGWTATEIEQLNLLKPADWRRLFKRRGSISAILAEHVWEHLSEDEGREAARQCYQYLKPGGFLRVAVPDGFHPDPAYIEYVKPRGHGAGADDHKVLYNWCSLMKIFEDAGFEIELLEWFDVSGRFHYVNWDPADGKIVRSSRFDERNFDRPLAYTSIILDARKIDRFRLFSSRAVPRDRGVAR
jgi:predicted SAM-dependent methyltransferase